ncbi:hypothetical protein FD755_022479, partial [Muntiacus reevesi]
PVSCGKNLLKKFASKTKKLWCEGPSLGSQLTHKPLELGRLGALNGLLYKALTGLLCTPKVSRELYFSACRLFWRATLSEAQSARRRPSCRGALRTVCVQDKNHAAMMETDRLLAALDTASPSDTLGPTAHSSLCGIDHEALNKQILGDKRREKGHGTEADEEEEGRPRVDDDLSPKNHLRGGE